MRDHPVWFWIGVLTLAGTVWWYLEDERRRNVQWFEQDKKWDAKIVADLSDINDAMAVFAEQLRLQSIDLRHIEGRLHRLEQRANDNSHRFGEHLGDHKYMESLIRGGRPSRPAKVKPTRPSGYQDSPGR